MRTYVDNPTDADYAAAAREALRAKDLRLAIEQVSAALALSPLHKPHLRLLDDVLAASRRPLLLVNLSSHGAFFGLCAVRALVLARLNRLDEAIHALFKAAAFRPGTSFVPWAPAWVNMPKRAHRVRPETLAVALVTLVDAVRGSRLDDGRRANLEAALVIAERVAAQHPPTASLRVARSRMLRLLNRYDSALAQLDWDGSHPPWEIAVERAALHGERGEHDARIEWLERARQARPDEPSTYLDLGDAHLDEGALDQAVEAYEHAFTLDASSDWAVVSSAYARSLATDGGLRASLAAEALGGSMSSRGHALEADLTAFTTRLADPTDPVLSVIRSVQLRATEQVDLSTKLRFRVTTERPLAPSASVAFTFALALAGREGSLDVDHELGPPQFGPLWRAMSPAAPAVAQPPDATINCVVDLARMPFSWDAWCTRAAGLSASLRTDELTCLAHAMAYPSRPPSPDVDVARWVHGFQIAVAVLIALGPEAAEMRRDRLEPLFAGVDDWSAGAAVLGFRALARAEQALRPALLQRLRALLPSNDAPLLPLARALAITGCELASGEARRDFLRLRARIRAELADRPKTDGADHGRE